MADYVLYPQVLRKVTVENGAKKRLMEDPEVCRLADAITARMAGSGRLLLRPSGTEPVIRVMIEGEDQESIERYCDELVSLLTQKAKQMNE